MQKKQKRLCFGTLPYMVFFVYALFITLATWVDAVFFLQDLQVPYHLIGLLLTVGLAVLVYRFFPFTFRKYSGSRLLLLFGAFILLLTVLRGMIPDTASDTLNYHLVSQKQFIQGFEGNCAPGNFQLYGFALGDKLNYLPRIFFGYRVGSMFSGVVLCLVLYQVSELLHLLCGERLESLRKQYFSGTVTKYFSFLLREETWAFIAVFTHDNIMLLGSYYVDLFALPFLLEAVYQIVSPQEETAENAVYFILCVGFLFAIKMTNLVYLLPLIVLYLIKIRKIVKPGLFILCVVVGFFPCLPYLLVNWIEYGNPVYPYYNTIFKSIYYPETDFKDGRFGPQSLQEELLWPFYMVFAPEYRQTEIPATWTGGLAVGMLSAIATAVACVIQRIRKKVIDRKILAVDFIVISSFVLWEVTTGISRYYLGGYVLLTCLFVWFCTQYLLGKTRLRAGIGVLCSVLVLLQVVYAFREYRKGKDWSWRQVTMKTITANISCLFRDRPSDANLPENLSAFFTVDTSAGISQLLSPETPLYRMDYLYDTLGGTVQENLKKEVNTLLEEGNVYLIGNSREFGMDTLEKLNRYGLYVDGCTVVEDTPLDTVRDVLLFHVTLLEEGKTNVGQEVPFTMERGNATHLTALCNVQREKKNQYLQLQDENGNILYSMPTEESGITELSLDFPATMGQTLEWVLVDGKGREVEKNPNTIVVFNMELSD